MAKLIRLERLLHEARRREDLAREEAFWRKSMVPVSIAMGIIIMLASGAFCAGVQWGVFSDSSMIWVVVAALVSIFALTKIVVANLLFYALANEQPRYPETNGPQPTHRDRLPIPLRVGSDGGLVYDDRAERISAIAVNQ